MDVMPEEVQVREGGDRHRDKRQRQETETEGGERDNERET
jgi:hypothetical protein